MGIAWLTFWAALWVLLSWRSRALLGRIPPLPHATASTAREHLPRLSVIVPARNEAATVERAMRSLLEQSYPQMQIIAINDHSTDETGVILDRLATGAPRLRVLHNPILPPGWLGKPNAQHRGVQHACGEWLVFTDADIVFEPEILERAVATATERDIEGLSLLPRLDCELWAEAAQMPWFVPLGVFTLHPHESNRERGMGFAAGAFILIRRTTYEAIGGHQTLRSAVLDDVELGRRVKEHGFRFHVYEGHDAARVTMYRSLRGYFFGMVKNISYVVGGRHGQPLLAPLFALPFAALVSLPVLIIGFASALGDWPLLAAGAVAYLLPVALALAPLPIVKLSRWHLFLYPLPVWLLLGAAVVASYYRITRGSVLWRGREVVIRPSEQRPSID